MSAQPISRRAKPTYRLDHVAVGSLNVDLRYQRHLSDSHVRNLIAEWNILRVGPIVVSQREDGSLWVIEGQHRKAAGNIAMGPQWQIPAMIWSGLTGEEEADGWLANIRRKGTTGPQEHVAYVTAGKDQVALAIQDSLTERGLAVGSGTSTTIKGVRTLRTIVERYGVETLEKSIDTLDEAFGRSTDTWNSNAMMGMAIFTKKFPEARHDRVIRTMRKLGVDHSDRDKPVSATEFANTALAHLAGGGGTGSRGPRVAVYLAQKYNEGLRTMSRLDV